VRATQSLLAVSSRQFLGPLSAAGLFRATEPVAADDSAPAPPCAPGYKVLKPSHVATLEAIAEQIVPQDQDALAGSNGAAGDPCGHQFGLADLVAIGAKSIDELADATHAWPVGGAARAGAHEPRNLHGRHDGPDRQTALSDTLRSDHPESIRPSAMMLGAHFVWKPCGALEETVRTAQPQFELVYGAAFFEYLARHPDDAAVFNPGSGLFDGAGDPGSGCFRH
jgi:hypothetical protein